MTFIIKEGNEIKVCRLLILGYRYKDIADKLQIAEVTVRKILEKIQLRNNLKSRISLAIEYYRNFGYGDTKKESKSTKKKVQQRKAS